MKETKKPKTWMRYRHRVIRNQAYAVLAPYSRLKFGVRVEKFREQGDRAYLVLLNHQTTFDQFFVGMAFRGPVYYVATEDIFSLGWISSLLRWAIAPIPIRKQTTDINAVRNCIKVAREGGTIAMAPEGNRTYSGRTEYMNPAVVKLAKKMRLPIALFRIEGGYGVQPRWSDDVRKGKLTARVAQVIEPEEYAALSDEELLARIQEGLYVDEAREDGLYKGKARAQYLERAMYVCPSCGLSKFESSGHEIRCTTCNRVIHYGEDKTLSGVGFQFPFRFVAQWYDYQKSFVNRLDPTEYLQTPMFRDEADVSEVIVYKRKNLLRSQARLALYGDRVVIDEGSADELTLRFEDVMAAACLGRNKLNIYHGSDIYQFKGDKRFNALKYVNICFRYKNYIKGEDHGEFLGL